MAFTLLEQIKIRLRQFKILEVVSYRRRTDFPATGSELYLYYDEVNNTYYLWDSTTSTYVKTDISTLTDDDKIRFIKTEENYILNQLIAKAKQDIINYRRYPSDYDAETIEADVTANYSNIIIDLVLYDYATEGMDFESQHTENSVTRQYTSRDKILGKVIPFCNILN